MEEKKELIEELPPENEGEGRKTKNGKKAAKIMNLVFGILCVLSCAFSAYLLVSEAAAIGTGDLGGAIAAILFVVMSLYHFAALAVVLVFFIVTCVLAKKNHVNILFFILTFLAAVLLNGGVLLTVYLV